MQKFQQNIDFIFIGAIISAFTAVIVSEMLYMIHTGNNFWSWSFVATSIGAFVYIYKSTRKLTRESAGTYLHNNSCKETDTGVYFYTPKHYCLDNFSAFSIDIWDKTFPTSEHAYQWKKFETSAPEIATQILAATSPNAVKKISDAYRVDIAKDFDKLVVMEEILRAKLAQHEKVQRVLKETGNKTIYENSPTDSYWGVGEAGEGQNKLGELWMRLRDTR